jgi:hypothetical protein
MVDRQAKRHSGETFSRQGKGGAIRDRSGISSKPCHREGVGEGKGEMSHEKSTDPGLSAAERKALRGSEAKEAMADHEDAQKAFQGNHERLRNERLAREAAAGPMLYPAPELPDDTLVGKVRFSTRVRNALNAAGMKTIGEVREASDEVLLSLPDFGKSSVAHLRQTLGPPSTDGVRPVSKRPT